MVKINYMYEVGYRRGWSYLVERPYLSRLSDRRQHITWRRLRIYKKLEYWWNTRIARSVSIQTTPLRGDIKCLKKEEITSTCSSLLQCKTRAGNRAGKNGATIEWASNIIYFHYM
jgi:hypothetical protein